VMMEISSVVATDKILDAGCGVGGAAIFLSMAKNAEVVGISLSDKQIEYAIKVASKHHPDARVSFKVMDFTRTTFPDESFDVIWACESVCQANKKAFINESYRLLKKGGRLIMADFFLTSGDQPDKHAWIRKWCDTWAVSELISCDLFTDGLQTRGFKSVKSFDYNQNIKHSAKRMYLASLFGALPSELYNLIHPEVSPFAKNHYKCGYYQYRALKEGLWRYMIILAIKKAY
jgi:tocopherol O-methyltransferase